MRELIFELYKLPEGVQPVINISYEEVRKSGYIATGKARYSKWYNWKFDFSANETKKNIQVKAREGYIFLPNALEFMAAYNHSFSIKAYVDEDVEESRLIDIAEMKSPLKKEFGCFTPDTEILTARGWVPFPKLTMDDHVITLNPKSHVIEYHKPNKLISYPYTGDLIHVKSRSVDLLVTPNHNFFVYNTRNSKHRLVRADELHQLHLGWGVPLGGHWTASHIRNSLMTSRKTIMARLGLDIPLHIFIPFLGLWLSEGWCTQPNIISLQMNDAKVGKQIFDKLCSNLPLKNVKSLKYRIYNNSTGYEFKLRNKELYNYLKPYSGAFNKRIPRDVLMLPSKHLNLLWEWMLKGDGTVDAEDNVVVQKAKPRRMYYTSSKGLADDVQELLIKTGKTGSIYCYNRPKGKIGDKEFDRQLYYCIYERRSEHWYPKAAMKTTYPYSGMVYCCTVPNHVIYVRRNGKPTWIGNCHEYFTLFVIKEVTNLEAVDNWLDVELYTCCEKEELFRERVDRICKPIVELVYGPEYVAGPVKVVRNNPKHASMKLVYRNPYTNEDEYLIVDDDFNIIELSIRWEQPANNPLRWSKERLKQAYESGELEKRGVRIE